MLLVDDYDRLKNSNPVAICRPFSWLWRPRCSAAHSNADSCKESCQNQQPKAMSEGRRSPDLQRCCEDVSRWNPKRFQCFLISRWLDQSWVTSTKSLIRARTSLEPKATTQEHCLDFHQAYRKAYTSRDMHCTSTALALQYRVNVGQIKGTVLRLKAHLRNV